MGFVRLLLDTCCFLWLARESRKLSPVATTAVNDPANTLFMSDASVWEISLKHSPGKLPLPDRPRRWLPRRLAFFQVQTLPISHGVIFRSGELPRVHHDPFDRLLAAQALEGDLTILSPDKPLALFGAPMLW